LNDNLATVEQALAGYKVGTYDTDKLPSVAGGVLGSSQGLLDDLPSTATWLMNKVCHSSTVIGIYFVAQGCPHSHFLGI
jgi:hypothetical protein